jgi:sugar phosphate isomerase/epimerase
MKKYGIASRSYGSMTVAEAAKFMAAHGYNCTELCMAHPDFGGWAYNGISALDENGITKELTKEKADIMRDNGIDVTAFGVFTDNLAPGDDEYRQKSWDAFVRCMDFAAYAGIKNLSTELGFRPDNKRGITTEFYESDFQRLKESFIYLGNAAKERGLNICIEACVIDIIPSAKRLRDFIWQINKEAGLTNIKVLLDMANFIANSDEDDVFKYLSPYIAYFHGKDRKVNDCYGRILGEGEIDWVKFFMNYYRITPDIPFILEYTNAETTDFTNERVERFTRQAKSNLAFMRYNVQDMGLNFEKMALNKIVEPPKPPQLVVELKVIMPESAEDSDVIIELLRQNKTVILNCEKIDKESSKSIIDAVIFNVSDVRIQQVSDKTYVLTPYRESM